MTVFRDRKKPNPHPSDKFNDKDFLVDVVRRCQDGDSRAMEMVYLGYKESLYNLAFPFAGDSSLSKDLLQDIFIHIFQNIKSLRVPQAFNGWLYRIAFNTCISFVRQKRRKPEVSLDVEQVVYADEGEHPMRAHLESALQSLPVKQKTVLLLHDLQGFTHKEIARITGLSEGTSKSQLFKARMKVRESLRSRT